jgi:hypothetical protein
MVFVLMVFVLMVFVLNDKPTLFYHHILTNFVLIISSFAQTFSLSDPTDDLSKPRGVDKNKRWMNK